VIDRREIKHFHLFCGLGGGARGFNAGQARVGRVTAKFRCIGGVDTDRAALADFRVLAGVPGTYLDLFDRDQYVDWHGHEPPDDWLEATPEDIQRAAGGERPNVVFTSPPCKGFSALLSAAKSGSDKYQALNRLTLRGIWLGLEAWQDDPPEFWIMENVPRISTRGRPLLDQIVSLLEQYGYAVAETTHDCGELGGLAQSRRRFLLVARHRDKVPPFLYEPEKKALLGVGDVLGAFPMPEDPAAGPMHRLPRLQWRTWVRLAFVRAGGDWRSLERLRVAEGVLSDFGIIPAGTNWHGGTLGVLPWDSPSGAISGRGIPTCGRFSVADPMDRPMFNSVLGVCPWEEPSHAVIGTARPYNGRYSAADIRMRGTGRRFNNVFRVVPWGEPTCAVAGGHGPSSGGLAVADPCLSPNPNRHHNQQRVVDWDKPAATVIGATRPGSGALSVADPRMDNQTRGKYRVTKYDEPAGAVIAASSTGTGAFSVADPMPGLDPNREHYKTGGQYGVVPWDAPAGTVTAGAKHDRGKFAVADTRPAAGEGGLVLPGPKDSGLFVIQSMDGTWHRPFSTLELAALQGLVDPDEHLELEGLAHSAWRERIGNAVPAPAAQAIASVIGQTLLLAWTKQRVLLSTTPVWVRQVAVAMAVDL